MKKTKKIKVPILSEYEECLVFVEYLELRGLLFTHIPAETFTKSWGIKMRNKRMGVRRGFPDYAISYKDKLLFVEMKRKKGSVTSPEQNVWISRLDKVKGVSAIISFGADEAIAFVEEVINN